MKLLKKPAVAFLLAFVLVIASTLISVKAKLENNLELVCETLCDRVLDFAVENNLASLETEARTIRSSGSRDLKDYAGLIMSYSEQASGFDKDATRSVDQAVKNYNRFLQETERFPAGLFVSLLNIC